MSNRSDDSRTIALFHVGGTGHIDAEGNIVLDQTRVRRIGIENLADVVEHRISAIVGSIAHHVKFNNGGELYYVYNQQGEIVELTGRDVLLLISFEGDYLFGTRA
jgi:hypothetical protein